MRYAQAVEGRAKERWRNKSSGFSVPSESWSEANDVWRLEPVDAQARQTASRPDYGAMIDQVRNCIANCSEQYISDLKAEVAEVIRCARQEIQSAKDRAELAKTRAASERVRADAAEQGWRETEARFNEIMAFIVTSELDSRRLGESDANVL